MDESKNKQGFNWRKYKIVLPIISLIIGILLMVLFFAADLSGVLFLIGFVLIVFGAIFLKHWWGSQGEYDTHVIVTDKKVPVKQVNSMNIYPDKIIFEEVYKPQGQPWKCENDGKSYFIHIWNQNTNNLDEFKLPDQTYLDPQILATRVLELPAHQRIFRRKQTLLQQLSPLMAALGAVIMWIVILTTT